MLSYARIPEGIEVNLTPSDLKRFDVRQDSKTKATFIMSDYGLLVPESDLTAVNQDLQEKHSEFEEQVQKAIPEAYTDVLLLDQERMKILEGSVQGFALALMADNQFKVFNENSLSEINPYLAGYGSLLNPLELVHTYGAHVGLADDNIFWIVAHGLRAIFNKVPTRNFWEKDPDKIHDSAVLNIEDSPEGKLVAIVYDTRNRDDPQNEKKFREIHNTFSREQDYRFREIPKDAFIEEIISDRNDPYDSDRPLFAVQAHKLKINGESVNDIQALNSSQPILRYMNTIINGLGVVPQIEKDLGYLLMTYSNNTLMPDSTILIDYPGFKEELSRVENASIRAVSALARVDAYANPIQKR